MARESGNPRPAEQPAVKTTIVGGRPPGPGKLLGDVPHGIEVLLIEASVDPRFRALLLEKRAEAAKFIGVTLTPAEAELLNGVPADQLAQVIAETRVSRKLRAARRRKVAAVALAALGAGAVAHGCQHNAKYLGRLEEKNRQYTIDYSQGRIIVVHGMVADPNFGVRDEPLLEQATTVEELPGRGEREARELKHGGE